MNNDCIFCKIVRKEIPATIIDSSENTLAFLDIHPVNLGHALVIPKGHYANIYETPEHVIMEMMQTSKKLSSAIKTGLHADGVNVTMSNDPAAGQEVIHAHIHIIPRMIDDGFNLWHGEKQYKEGEQEEVAEKIKNNLTSTP